VHVPGEGEALRLLARRHRQRATAALRTRARQAHGAWGGAAGARLAKQQAETLHQRAAAGAAIPAHLQEHTAQLRRVALQPCFHRGGHRRRRRRRRRCRCRRVRRHLRRFRGLCRRRLLLLLLLLLLLRRLEDMRQTIQLVAAVHGRLDVLRADPAPAGWRAAAAM
jgi:hypothetical protein